MVAAKCVFEQSVFRRKLAIQKLMDIKETLCVRREEENAPMATWQFVRYNFTPIDIENFDGAGVLTSVLDFVGEELSAFGDRDNIDGSEFIASGGINEQNVFTTVAFPHVDAGLF